MAPNGHSPVALTGHPVDAVRLRPALSVTALRQTGRPCTPVMVFGISDSRRCAPLAPNNFGTQAAFSGEEGSPARRSFTLRSIVTIAESWVSLLLNGVADSAVALPYYSCTVPTPRAQPSLLSQEY